MTLTIAGKTAIVTGAANGIGLAIAQGFADRGARVMFADLGDSKLSEDTLGTSHEEGDIRFFSGDLSQKLAIANLLSATVDAFDRVDIVVNASRQIATSDPLNADDGTLDEMLRLNFLTALRLGQMAARRMIGQAEKDGNEDGPVGSIVNITTLASRFAHPDLLAYSVAGAALEQATRTLAVALAPRRIRVNGIAFGSVMSGSLQATLRENPDWNDRIVDATPLGHIAAPAELIDTALYLASEGSSFVTGQILTVDGGRSLSDPAGPPAY